MPQEIEVWYVLPATRKEFALEMVRSGLKQKKVADMLGVTEAAVSQYLSSKRAKEIDLDPQIKIEIKKSVKNILGKKANIIEEIQRILKIIKERGLLCEIHRKHHGCLPEKCSVCMK